MLDRVPFVSFLRMRLLALSGIGVALGTLFFAGSLTPSLLPRTFFTQGVLAGTCFVAGYGIGVFWRWLWAYLELPEPPERYRWHGNVASTVLSACVAILFLWKASEWQNSIRSVMELPPVESAHPFKLCLIALLTFAVLLGLGRLFLLVARRISGWIKRVLPRRLANVLGIVLAGLVFWSLASDVVLSNVMSAVDSSFRELDGVLEPERPRPSGSQTVGGPDSLLKWNDLGRTGRQFVSATPSAEEISAISGRPAIEPIRVYAGLRAGKTPAERAEIALEELKRIGAFERSVLILITPTGTGWIDPAAMDAVEFLHDGDVASVAVQYSYLSSPLSLIFEPDYGRDAARALFTTVYRYWRELPAYQRPELYLHGLSLGSMNSEKSLELFEIIGDPINGALWSGPPFESRMWRQLTNDRVAGSPAWLPKFHDGSFARFMNQDGSNVPADTPWGPTRIVYLQYASDPVVFFDYHDLYREPDWMQDPRGHDVSPELRWYPIVTMLQLAVDMAVATTSPIGFGHVYAPEHYADAWVEVTNVQGWSPEALAQLKEHLKERMASDDENIAPDDSRGG